MGRSRSKTAMSNVIHNRRDFSWSGAPKSNPYRQNTKKFPFKKIFFLFVLVSSVGGMLGFLLFHQTFSIDRITVSGLHETSSSSVRTAIDTFLTQKKWRILSYKNYFVLPEEKLARALSGQFPLGNIQIIKKFPNELTVAVTEKPTTIILVKENTAIMVSEDGTRIENAPISVVGMVATSSALSLATTSTAATTTIETHIDTAKLSDLHNSFPSFPILVDERDTTSSDPMIVPPPIVASVLDWYDHLAKKTNITIGYSTLQSDLGEGSLVTIDGWAIKLRFTGLDTSTQFIAFDSAYHAVQSAHTVPKYIDVRFGNRVFWK